MSEANEILTAKEYSDRKGKDGSWGARLAKQANEAGYPFPQKKGNYWVSTYEEWENVLEKLGIQLRNRESYRKE
ncbi:hypothetical protein AKG34_21355 [Peribacillus butanolivorans]|uniref:hypothetical protein n=1 Tax=Peribacillus butanolivorans TaxID=421767 RepID=UPI0006A6B553|nr:hypothetical protein [Peribacillus butanolivorans]KON67369.1 hypothetical protein AKG34_21355 [Peribacillus butanolivorans]